LYEAVFRQYGVIRVQDYDELLEVSHLLANCKKPPQRGISVVSHSGGISSLTADMLGLAGLDLPQLTPHARDGINGILKDFGWAANPADVTGFARGEHFPKIMDYMIGEPTVGTLVIASAGAGNQVEQVIAQRDASDKGVVFFWTASRGDKTTLPKLKASNIPIFYSPEKLARGLKFMLDYHAWRDSRTTGGAAKITAPDAAQKKVLQQLGTLGRTTLSESESKQAIAAWGVSAPREILATSAAGAAEAAKKIGYPVVMKVDSPDILHKTEAGVVRLGLRNAEEAQAAYAEIMANAAKHAANAKINGAIVQEMVTGGVEVIVGVSYDAQLGPMLLFGSGGVMVEVYNDVALRHCPITRSEAVEMIAEVKGAKLLRGFRGKPAADVDALADTLVRVSQLAVHLDGKLAELDINPLMVLPKGQGVKAVDALVVLHG